MLFDDSILGWMHVNDLKVINNLATIIPENGVVVEIGSLFGRSTVAWAMSCNPTVKIYCGDIFHEHYIDKHTHSTPTAPISGKVYNSWEEFQKNTNKFPNVIPMRGRAPYESKYPKFPIDLLFVDALHKNPDDWNIIKYFAKFVKVGGAIAGHDYCDEFPDVKQNADMLSNIYKTPIETFTNIPQPSTIWKITVTKEHNYD
jgi:hypothetical protein